MTDSPALSPSPPRPSVAAHVEPLLRRLNAVPYSVLVLVPRAAIFSVFFRSGMTKIKDWDATVALFQDEYKVPILPPDLAARMAASVELGASTLILLGLFSRPAALVIFGMIATIQLFVYPSAWPDHIQWAAMLVFILFRGPGAFSLDAILGRALGLPNPARRPHKRAREAFSR